MTSPPFPLQPQGSDPGLDRPCAGLRIFAVLPVASRARLAGGRGLCCGAATLATTP